MAIGIIITAAVVVALGLLWVRLVPNERDRINQVIWLWVAMPVIAILLAIAHWFDPSLY